MKMNRFAIAAVLTVAFTACGPLGKFEPVIAEDTETIKAPEWNTVYQDPCLQNLIDTALVRNFDLRMAYEHIQQAEAVLLGAKLSYIPTLGINPTIKSSFSGNGFNGQSWEYSVPASSSWQLNIFSLINSQKTAEAGAAQSKAMAMATRSKLIASVANTYFTLLMLEEEMKASLEMERTWSKSVETIQALMDNGMADNVAVCQYVANHKKVQGTIEELKDQISQTRNAMAMLLGYNPGFEVQLGNINEQSIPKTVTEMIPVEMLSARPDVQAAQRDVEIAFYTTKQAWLNFFPKLCLNGSIGMVSPGSGALTPITALATLGAGITVPVLNAGVNRSNLKKAESMQREARISFDKTLLNAGMEVNNAINSYNSYIVMEDYYKGQVEALKQACIDTDYMMKNSSDKTYLDVLIANTSYFDAVLGQIAAKTKRLQAAVSLYESIGGGAEI